MRLPLIAAAFLAASPALALDLPARKPGLWDMTMNFEGRNLPPRTTQFCIDAATDKMMSAVGGDMQEQMCSKRDLRAEGGGYVMDSVCQIGPLKVTSHGVVSGDFNSAYTVKTTSKREGSAPGLPAGDSAMTIEAKWLGPCKPGQRPGDMMLPGGRTMNMMDMRKMMPGGAPPPPR